MFGLKRYPNTEITKIAKVECHAKRSLLSFAWPRRILSSMQSKVAKVERRANGLARFALPRPSYLRRQPTMTDLLLAWICFPFRAVLIDVVHGAWEACVADMENAVFLTLFKVMRPSGIPVREIARSMQLSPDETASFRWRAVVLKKTERGYSGFCNLLIF